MGVEGLKIPNNGLICENLRRWGGTAGNVIWGIFLPLLKAFKVSRGAYLVLTGWFFCPPRIQDSGCSAAAHV